MSVALGTSTLRFNAILHTCASEGFILQKLNYYHRNPCKGKWKLCVERVDYIHSSAKYYILRIQKTYEVTNCADLLEIDLNIE